MKTSFYRLVLLPLALAISQIAPASSHQSTEATAGCHGVVTHQIMLRKQLAHEKYRAGEVVRVSLLRRDGSKDVLELPAPTRDSRRLKFKYSVDFARKGGGASAYIIESQSVQPLYLDRNLAPLPRCRKQQGNVRIRQEIFRRTPVPED